MSFLPTLSLSDPRFLCFAVFYCLSVVPFWASYPVRRKWRTTFNIFVSAAATLCILL